MDIINRVVEAAVVVLGGEIAFQASESPSVPLRLDSAHLGNLSRRTLLNGRVNGRVNGHTPPNDRATFVLDEYLAHLDKVLWRLELLKMLPLEHPKLHVDLVEEYVFLGGVNLTRVADSGGPSRRARSCRPRRRAGNFAAARQPSQARLESSPLPPTLGSSLPRLSTECMWPLTATRHRE